MAQFLVLLLGFGLASLPFVSDRVFAAWSLQGVKSAWVCLAEWFVLFFVYLLVSLGIEQRLQGTVHEQDWEFYVILFFLFTVFAVPGFVWRFLWSGRNPV